jgi:hypothetical protein
MSRKKTLEDQVDANSSLSIYLARTVQNVIPTLMEAIGEIVAYIDDAELSQSVLEKLAAMGIVQELVGKEDEK